MGKEHPSPFQSHPGQYQNQTKPLLKLTKTSVLSVPCYGWGKASSLHASKDPTCMSKSVPKWAPSSAMAWLFGLQKQIWTDLEIKTSFAGDRSLFVEYERCEEGVCSEGTQNGRIPHVYKWFLSQLAAWRCWSQGHHLSLLWAELASHCWYPTEPVSSAKTAGRHHTPVGNQ